LFCLSIYYLTDFVGKFGKIICIIPYKDPKPYEICKQIKVSGTVRKYSGCILIKLLYIPFVMTKDKYMSRGIKAIWLKKLLISSSKYNWETNKISI